VRTNSRRIRPFAVWAAIIVVIGPLSLWFARSEERTFVDEWSVLVIDTSQTPLAGVPVSESCADYTVGWEGGGDLVTNAQGEARFPRHSMRATRFYWAAAPILSRIHQGFHASSGLYAMISVNGPNSNGIDSHNCRDQECRRGPMRSVIQISLHGGGIGHSNARE
jgi:hypothetical protein